MTRREFAGGLAMTGVLAGAPGCRTAGSRPGRILFGACRGIEDVKLMASIGYDFWEGHAVKVFEPEKDGEWWERQKGLILAQPLPLRSCNCLIPGTFRLTGPKADPKPALDFAETIFRRAEEVGVKTLVLGAGGARNVPGDLTGPLEQRPDTERGRDQYAAFCGELCRRVADLRTATLVVEPLRPKESNIINYVWQGLQIVEEINSPRLAQLADIFHMMMGREDAESIVRAGSRLKHCHVASYETRRFPGSEPETVERFRPYFDALRAIGYTGGVSCECGWGEKADLRKNLETALKTLRGLG